MSASNKAKLNEFYEAELASLRSSGAEFSDDYPEVAKELELSDGISRDPHVEHLVQSFAWMVARLKLQMEAESKKLPAMLLQELEPSLVSSKPPMAIAECEIDIAGIDLSTGHRLNAGQTLAPVQLSGSEAETKRLQNCRFTIPFAAELVPLTVTAAAKNSAASQADIHRLFPRAQSFLTLTLSVSAASVPLNYELNKPLRFFIGGENGAADTLYDILAGNLLGLAINDSTNRGITKLAVNQFNLCGFEDEERMLPQKPGSELGVSLLQDYLHYREKFRFFEINGLQRLNLIPGNGEALAHIKLHFALDQNIPNGAAVGNDSFKLNCFPIVNLFERTTEPVLLHEKNYRYPLMASRSYSRDYEIYSVNSVYGVNNRGIQHEVQPYYAFRNANPESVSAFYVEQKEENLRRNTPGSDTWISIYHGGTEAGTDQGLSVFAQATCSNRLLCEDLQVGQMLSVVGAAPIKSLKLLSRPSLYRPADLGGESHWKLFASLSRYHLSLNDVEFAKETLVSFLKLCAGNGSVANDNLLESIESVKASEHHVPSKKGGWRGYHQGTLYQIVLNERKFIGSAMLFGRVLLQFLALFCPVNSFATLELYLGSRRVHRWPPMNGHMTLV